MPEAEETRPTPKPPTKRIDDEATDALADAADVVRKYQNHIVIATCLVILGVFGWRWWSGQKSTRESWAWQGLKEGATVQQLEQAVDAYRDTGAAPYLKLQLAKTLHEEGKLPEAKKLYDELQSLGESHLAAQLARGRITGLKKEEEFLKILPSKLAELAKNAPSALPLETPVHMGQQEVFGPPRDAMPPTDPPK